MANQYDVHAVAVNVGALSNAKRGLFKVPSGGGGITILDANLVTAGAGTSTVNLIKMTGGTTSSGTIASPTAGTGVVFAANVPQGFTVATPYVAEGSWVGLEELNVGALNAVAIISLTYIMGK